MGLAIALLQPLDELSSKRLFCASKEVLSNLIRLSDERAMYPDGILDSLVVE